MVLRFQPTHFRVRWTVLEKPNAVDLSAERETPWWTIDFVWVLPDLRRHGIGRRLVTLAADIAGMPAAELAWAVPFTEGGMPLARAVTGDFVRISR